MEQTLSVEAAQAICQHMNDDHADAIAGYARTYAGIARVDTARIVGFDGNGMDLAIASGSERITARITFDHELLDSDDARRTLIAMARRAGTL